MISTELYNGQGLGNQLWVYVVARVLADKNDCPFSISNKEEFKGRNFMTIDFGVTSTETPKNYYRERMEYLAGTDIDISRTDPILLTLAPDTKFDGNCQSTLYLKGYREKILQWLSLNDEYKQYVTNEKICVIHLRFGDFEKQKDVFLPKEYYKHAMAYLLTINKEITFAIVTDEKTKAESFLPGIPVIGSSDYETKDEHMASHHRGGPLGIDFAILMQAKYLIIPNSSFSWWAAYLNNTATTIIAPKYWARHNISDGYWSASDSIADEFTYIDRQGIAYTPAQCWAEKEAYETAHPTLFTTTPYKQKKTMLECIINKLWKSRK